MPVKYREIVWEIVRVLLTAVGVYTFLVVCASAAYFLGLWLCTAELAGFWFGAYLVFIAPITSIAVAVWLWLLENYYE